MQSEQSHRVPRNTLSTRSSDRLSSSVEEAILAVCRAAPRSKSGHAALVDFRKQTADLENRFIAHVIAELRNSKPHTRSREEPRKRPRSVDHEYLPDRFRNPSNTSSRSKRRASTGSKGRHAVQDRPRRACVRTALNDELSDDRGEPEPFRPRFPRRSKQVINLDDDFMDEKFTPEVLEGARETGTGSKRREQGGLSREQLSSTVGNEEDSESTFESGCSLTDGEEELIFPIVQPRRMVRERALSSDYMSLTPVIADDDEGTDTEERRKALARRPLRPRTRPEAELRSVFGIPPGHEHRLHSDYMVLLPGLGGSVRLPQPEPEGISRPNPNSQILMHPLLKKVAVIPQHGGKRYCKPGSRPVQDASRTIRRRETARVPPSTEKLPSKRTQDGAQSGHPVNMSLSMRDGRGVDQSGFLKYSGVKQYSVPGPPVRGTHPIPSLPANLVPVTSTPNGGHVSLDSRDQMQHTQGSSLFDPQSTPQGSKPRSYDPRVGIDQELLTGKSQFQYREPLSRTPNEQISLKWKSRSSTEQTKASWPKLQADGGAQSSDGTMTVPDSSSVVGSTPGMERSSRFPSYYLQSTHAGEKSGMDLRADGKRMEGNATQPGPLWSAGEKGKDADEEHADDPNGSLSASSVRPQQLLEPVINENMSGFPVHAGREAMGIGRSEVISLLSPNTAQLLNFAARRRGAVQGKETREAVMDLGGPPVQSEGEKTSSNDLNRPPRVEKGSSTLVLPSVSIPAYQRPTPGDGVVANSAIVRPGLSYPRPHSQIPAPFGAPPVVGLSGSGIGIPGPLAEVPALTNVNGGMSMPYNGMVMNGVVPVSGSRGMTSYPSGSAGSFVMHPYRMTPELAAAIARGASNAPHASNQQARDPALVRQIPTVNVQDFADVYRRAYLEFEKHGENAGSAAPNGNVGGGA